MDIALSPSTEAQRLTELFRMQILHTPPEERFDRITRLVAAYFKVPIAMINLVADTFLWPKACVGVSSPILPREVSFCASTILRDDMLVISDTIDDPQFCNNPLVTHAPHLRFYAGVPLRTIEGYAIDTLCIADTAPRELSSGERGFLRDFACWAERELTTEELSQAILRQQGAEDALRASEIRYATVIAALNDGVVMQNADGSIETCNASAERILGLSAEQMVGRTSVDSRWRAVYEDETPYPGEDHPSMIALRTGQPQINNTMGVHKPDGTLTWIQITSQPLFHPNESIPYGVVSSFVDVTKQKQYEQQLKLHNAALLTLASTDGLTKVANKRTFLERLDQELGFSRQHNSPLSLILLDVDSFKSYNDTFGHPAGDEVLRQVAQILVNNARSTDLVARYGGEEFVVILPRTNSTCACTIAERLRGELAQAAFPHRAITASFGIASTIDGSMYRDELVVCADEALYTSKRQGRNQVTLWSSLEAVEAVA